MIAPGTGVSFKGKRITTKSSDESQWLSLIYHALETLNGSLHNVFTSTPAVYTIGTTTGAPVNGQSTWTISTINVIGKNPVFLKGGVLQVSGTDYTFNNATGVLTLASGTFATGNVWTVLY